MASELASSTATAPMAARKMWAPLRLNSAAPPAFLPPWSARTRELACHAKAARPHAHKAPRVNVVAAL